MKVEVGLERLLVDGQPAGPYVLLELGEQQLIDGEARFDHFPIAPLDGDPRVPRGDEPLREGDELPPGSQQSAEARRVEPRYWTGHEMVGLDPAAAVDLTPGVGELPVGRGADRRRRLA